MNKKSLELLEFQKVIEEIKKYALTSLGIIEIENIHPLNDRNIILKESEYVTEAKKLLIQLDIPPIEFLPDLRESLSRSNVEGSALTIKQIMDIKKLAEISRRIYQYLKSGDPEGIFYRDYSQSLFVDKVFEHQLTEIFTDSGEIKDNATQTLRDIRRQIIEKSEQLRKSVGRILKKLSESYLVQEEYVTLRDGRIVVPIKSEHKRHVRGFIHSESATGQTVYIEPEETLDLNNEILSLSFAEKREIDRILKSITMKIGQVSAELTGSLSTIGKIDSIFAKARYSTEIIGSFPTIDDKKPFNIIQGRHPILLKKIKRSETIPLELKIENQKVILITGPNAGGKTVVLKTVGLLTLMVQAGLHIPADPDSNFWIFNQVLLDIGDQQSIEDDLSTFSSHLSNINYLINNADHRTLILLDELGTGTDPAEGAALATSILVKLRDLGTTVFATTHHGTLKIIASEMEGFQNASMLFDSKELKPTYIFSQGMPGSSYAFEVAKRIGLDDDLLETAKQYMDSSKTKVEEFLIDLEKKSNDLKDKLAQYERENSRLKGLTNLYSEKIDKLEKEKNVILKKAKEDAELYLKNVNRQVEAAIKKIKESNAEKEVIKAEKQTIEELKKKTNKIFTENNSKTGFKKERELAVGDFVKIKGTETTGKLIEIDGTKGVILSGSIKVKSKLEKLEYTDEKDVNLPVQSKYHLSSNINSLRLDIRGKKPDEAEFEVIKYIDEAYSNDIRSVEILHGKGSGSLKNTVKLLLEKHEAVKEFHYANIEYGGDGITIVELN
ncbi:MAG: endonuclease MutS2 [Melioribacteraceae bacterium]|nr:endonuclease MutS2 [Melioribacteraceae bacterium]